MNTTFLRTRSFFKTLFIFSILCTAFVGRAGGQSFTENMGTSTASSIAAYTGWQNAGTFTYTGTGDVRTTSASSGYTGASGGSNVFLTNTGAGFNFIISGINTSAMTGAITLSFGISKTGAAAASDFTVSYSTDGTTYTSFTPLSLGTGTAWSLVTPSGATIPATSNLRIKFTNVSTTTQYRIDDVTLTGASTYYSASTGNLNATATWSNLASGGTIHPTSFSLASQTFRTANSNSNFSANLAISGTGSKLIVDATDLTTSSSFSLTGTVDVVASRTLTLQNATLPTLGTLAATSTIVYSNGASNLLNYATTYGNVTFSGTSTSVTNTAGTLMLAGNFTLSSPAACSGSNITVTTTGSANQTITGYSGATFTLKTLNNNVGSTKTGTLSFAANTNITFVGGGVNMNNSSSTTVFSDASSSSIILGAASNLVLGGAADGYNLSGTILLNAASGTNKIEGDASDLTAPVASLNNITVNTTGSSTKVMFEPLTGGATTNINGAFTITTSGDSVYTNGNTINLAGNLVGSVDKIARATSGSTTVTAGTIKFNNSAAQSFSGLTAGITIANVALNNTSSTGLTANNSFNINNTFSTGTTTTKTLSTIAGASTTAIGSTINISGTASGSSPFVYLGGGAWNGTSGNVGGLLKLGGVNTLSGGITVGKSDGTSSGILELDGNTSFGSNTSGNDITIYPQSELFLNSSGTTYTTGNINLTLNGKGNNATTTTIGGALVTKSGSSYSWSGPVILGSDAAVSVLGSASLTLSGNITNTVTAKFIKTGNNSAAGVILSGTGNSWDGGTEIGAGSITVNSGSSISTGALSFTGYTTGVNTTLTLNNATQTVSSLSSSFIATTGTVTQTLSLGSGHTLTLNQSSNTVFGNTGTLTSHTSVITGAGALIKTGSGRLTLSSNGNAWSGGLTIIGGEIRFNPPGSVTMTSPVTLNGGTISTTSIANTSTISLGAFNLSDNSTIDLGTGFVNSIKFSSLGTLTSGKILNVTNWLGTYGGTTAGSAGKLFITTSATGLTTAQLAQITFTDPSTGYVYGAIMRPSGSGEIIPALPTITTTNASYGPYCNSATIPISVAFTNTGNFTAPYQVQYSYADGTFPSDVITNIASGSSTTSPIAATLPSGLAGGTAYKVRVVNTAPFTVQGSAITTPFTIVDAAPPITGPAVVYPGFNITLTDAAGGGTWTSSNVLIASVATATSTTATVTGVSDGTVTITYNGTSASPCSSPFTVYYTVIVTNPPKITGVSPNTGIPNVTNVTITGTNFASSGNKVYFGGVPVLAANIVSESSTSITVKVPFGATLSPISVLNTTSHLTALEDSLFKVYYNSLGFKTDSLNFYAASLLSSSAGALPAPYSGAIGDIDGDGKPDIAINNSGSFANGGASISLYLNSSTTGTLSASSFTAVSPFNLTMTGGRPNNIKLADIDGDGMLDIVATLNNVAPLNIAVFKNTSSVGTISFATAVFFDNGQSSSAFNTGQVVTVTDVDNDGKLDIIETSIIGGITIMPNTSVPGTITMGTPVVVAATARCFR